MQKDNKEILVPESDSHFNEINSKQEKVRKKLDFTKIAMKELDES